MAAVTIHSDFGTHGKKKDVLFIMLLLLPLSRFSRVQLCEDWNAKVGSQEILRVTGKFGPGVQNEAVQRLTEFCQKKTKQQTKEESTHGHHQMVNTEIRLIIFVAAKMEKLYTVCKNKTGN